MKLISTVLSWFQPGGIFFPCACAVCGGRLAVGEEVICADCNCSLTRTHQSRHPEDNVMARRFWLRADVKRCAAFVTHHPHAQSGNIVYELKYGMHPEYGRWMGRVMALEMGADGFFEGIDLIVPVPLAKVRLRQRGYNQSEEIATGIGEVTGLPVHTGIVARDTFSKSQTSLTPGERYDNVAGAFRLVDAEAVRGRHVLLVDDIVTTGATMTAVANVLSAAGDVTVSIASWGMAGV